MSEKARDADSQHSLDDLTHDGARRDLDRLDTDELVRARGADVEEKDGFAMLNGVLDQAKKRRGMSLEVRWRGVCTRCCAPKCGKCGECGAYDKQSIARIDDLEPT